MTAADLTVYGKPVGSLWDHVTTRARYKLARIIDNGGLGLYVSLLAVDLRGDARSLVISVSKLGQDFVPAPTTDDLTGRTLRCDLGRLHRVIRRTKDGWLVTDHSGVEGYSLDDKVIRSWSLVPDAEPAEDEGYNFAAELEDQLCTAPVKPKVVCLCGSTRFYDEFQKANYDLTMAGHIVLSVGFYPHAKAKSGHGEGVGHDSVEKVALDELHKRKIDLADEVLVLNVGGYVGDSTLSEIAYAEAKGKPVTYLEPAPLLPWERDDAAPYWREGDDPTEFVRTLANMQDEGGDLDPRDWRGGYFIPADLIEQLRRAIGRPVVDAAIKAILDAADGVTT